jgi:hypothetical protein
MTAPYDDDPVATAPGRAAVPAWRRPWWPVACCFVAALVVALVAFGGTLGGYFLGDDFAYVARFADYPWAHWPHLFAREWSEGLWGFVLPEIRPVTALSFMVDARLWGGQAAGFRLTNLLLHATCAGLVGLLTGRVDMLPTLFYVAGLGAFLTYREEGGRCWLVAAWLAYAAAVFAKEFGLTLPLMALVADLVWRRRGREWLQAKTWWPYAGWLAVAGAYLVCRRMAFGPGVAGKPLPSLGDVQFWTGLCQRQLAYLGQLFPPAQLWLHEEAPLVVRHARPALGAIAAGVAGAVWWWTRRPAVRAGGTAQPVVFFAAGWYLLATLPLMVASYFSARHLYLASAGVCVAWVLALRGVLPSHGGFTAAAAALVVVFGLRFAETVQPWREAAELSGGLARAVALVGREARPGAALVLDAPELREKVFVWAWGVRPPFQGAALDARLAVVARPAAYYQPDHWGRQPVLARLPDVAMDSWLVEADAAGRPRHLAVPAARLRAAWGRFAGGPLTPERWHVFIKELKSP